MAATNIHPAEQGAHERIEIREVVVTIAGVKGQVDALAESIEAHVSTAAVPGETSVSAWVQHVERA